MGKNYSSIKLLIAIVKSGAIQLFYQYLYEKKKLLDEEVTLSLYHQYKSTVVGIKGFGFCARFHPNLIKIVNNI